MPLLRWLAQLLSSTVSLAFNLAASTALLGVSAYLLTQGTEDSTNAGYVFRVVGAIWLFSAIYSYVRRGILQVPPAVPASKDKKPTGAQVAVSSLGCLASLAGVVVTFIVAGRVADWAWAGIAGDDQSHPARALADRGLSLAQAMGNDPEAYIPYVIGAGVALAVLRLFVGWTKPGPRQTARPKPRRGRQAQQMKQGDVGRTARDVHRPSAHEALAGFAVPSVGQEDTVLGRLQWSGSDSAWVTVGHEGIPPFPVRIEGTHDRAPTAHQTALARGAVQRSFEVLLRASEAVRPKAQAKGVGLPRFTIAAAGVGVDTGAATPVTMHLRCDSDPGTSYTARSTDGMHRFEPV